MPKHDGYKSRKFNFSVGIVILTSILLVATYVDATIWKDVIEVIIGAYMIGNVGERFVGRKNLLGHNDLNSNGVPDDEEETNEEEASEEENTGGKRKVLIVKEQPKEEDL